MKLSRDAGALLALLSGAILAASFTLWDSPIPAYFALVPLLAALEGATPRKGLALAGLFGLAFFAPSLFWMTHVNVLAWIGIVLFMTLQILPFGALVPFIRRRLGLPNVAAAPILWVAAEFLRSNLATGFPWLLLAYTQHGLPAVIQIADAGGALAVSFVVMIVNCALADLAAGTGCRRAAVLAAAASLVLAASYGTWRLRGAENLSGSLKVAIAQGNFPSSLDRDDDPDKVWERYLRLTREALGSEPDLVVWPEGAYPWPIQAGDPAAMGELRSLAKGAGRHFLVGAQTDVRAGESILSYNSVYLVSPAGSPSGRYDKAHLVPFGEYVPAWVPWRLKALTQDFRSGSPLQSPIAFPAGDLGVLICYEDAFPDIAASQVRRGARILAALTSDAWFGRSPELSQHLNVCVFRAVENRVPVIRAGNTGISALIDPYGRIYETLSVRGERIGVEGVLAGRLLALPAAEETAHTAHTAYTRYGDVFPWACSIAALLAAALACLAGKGRRSGAGGAGGFSLDTAPPEE